MSLSQAIDDLQTGITDTLTTAAGVTGAAISTALQPITASTTTIVGGFTSNVSSSVSTLSDSLYDPVNQSGILYDIQSGINTLGSTISTGLATTSSAVDNYTSETSKIITNASTFIVAGLALLAVALFINAYAVNTLDKSLKVGNF